MSELGERLSKLRRDKGMTQEELASHLQVTRQTVSSYENGKSEPDIAMLHKLSEALETEVSFLIDGKEPEEQEEKKQQDSKDRKKKIKLWLLQLAGIALILLVIRLAEPAIHRYVQDTFLLWTVFICKYMLYPLCFFWGGGLFLQLVHLLYPAFHPLRGKAYGWIHGILLLILIVFVLLAALQIAEWGYEAWQWSNHPPMESFDGTMIRHLFSGKLRDLPDLYLRMIQSGLAGGREQITLWYIFVWLHGCFLWLFRGENSRKCRKSALRNRWLTHCLHCFLVRNR